jgi:8-oxo-dGTP pyrophosphatase MutT (NUDIX family)
MVNEMSRFTHAGGIVFKIDDRRAKYLAITARHNPDHWIFPKGHIEEGESPEETAEREVLEECGVDAQIRKRLGSMQFEQDNRAIITIFFLMEYQGTKGSGEERQKRWCTRSEALNLLTFEGSKKLLKKADRAVGDM